MYTESRIPALRCISSFVRLSTGVLVLACLLAVGCTGDPADTALLPAQQTNPERNPSAAAVEVNVFNDSEYSARVQVHLYIGNTLVHHCEALLGPLSSGDLANRLLLDLEEADRVVITCRIDGSDGTALWSDQQTYMMGTDFADLDTVTYSIVYHPPANTAPIAVIVPLGDQLVGSTVTLDGSGSYDPDDDAITYQWTQLNSPPDPAVNLVPTASPWQVEFTAPGAIAGPQTLTFQLVVNDGQTDSAPATVVVDFVPAPPILLARPSGPFFAPADAGVTLDGTSSVGPIVSYHWAQVSGPPIFLPNPDQATVTFFAPSTGGWMTFELTVSDGINSHTASIDIYGISLGVSGTPPIALALNSSLATAGDTVELRGSGSFDPSGNSLTHRWRQIGGPAVTLSSTIYPDITFVAPNVPAETAVAFELLVISGNGLAATSVTGVVIEPAGYKGNHAPHLTATTDADEVYEGWLVNLASSANDVDGNTLILTWGQIFGTDVEATWLTNATSGPGYATEDHSFNAPVGITRWDHVLKFAVVAGDNQSALPGVDIVPVTVTVRLMGDVNGDGVVNSADETLVQSALGARPGDANWNPWADLDQSGVVDSADLQLVLDNMGRSLMPT